MYEQFQEEVAWRGFPPEEVFELQLVVGMVAQPEVLYRAPGSPQRMERDGENVLGGLCKILLLLRRRHVANLKYA
jgi:hypothetical protein